MDIKVPYKLEMIMWIGRMTGCASHDAEYCYPGCEDLV